MHFNILLVEDSPTDAAILISALKGLDSTCSIQVAQDGVEALLVLDRASASEGADLPHIILLDLNLPRKSGHDVLREIKQSPYWKATPAIIMSSSSTAGDIEKSYQLHANAYISKPKTLGDYQLVAQRIHNFWLQTAKLPLAE